MEDYELKAQILKALNKAYFYLKFRPRTRSEIVSYLGKKAKRFHWSQQVIDGVVSDLADQNLINDREFIEWFVRQRSAIKPKSVFALRMELLKLGIHKDLLDTFFQDVTIDEEPLALEALRRKWNRFQRLDPRERFQKAAAFLARRGFSFDVVKKTIKSFEDG